jgi:hypothetical protein
VSQARLMHGQQLGSMARVACANRKSLSVKCSPPALTGCRSIARTIAARTRSSSTRATGRMMSACPISSRGSPARPAGAAALTSGRYSRSTSPPRGIPPTVDVAVTLRPDGTRPAVVTMPGILVSQFRNKRRRAACFDPGGVPFRDNSSGIGENDAR